jgi:drug/metabolite transporter (DMT)-like permease
LAFRDDVAPLALVTLRGLTGALFVLAVAGLCGQLRGLPRRSVLGAVCVGGPLFGIQLLFYFAALQRSGAQMAVVLVHVYPALVVGLVWLRTRVRVRRSTALLLVAMLGGVALVAGSGGVAVSWTGAACALGSATVYSVYVVLGEAWVARLPPFAAGGLVTAGATAATGAVALATGTSLSVSASGWHYALAQGLVVVPVGLCGAFLALRRLGPVSASLLGMLEPVIGVGAAGLLLGERFTALQWVGAVVVVAACAVVPLVAPAPSPPVFGADLAAAETARRS